MKVDTSLNILVSYAYMQNKNFCNYIQSLVTSGKINLMIDSGAFTKHNAQGNFEHVTLDKYCDFLEKFAQYSEKYVMLDVVGKKDESRRNYELMLKRGLNPMYVVTLFDYDYDYIRSAVKQNPHICVAGGVTTKNDWLKKKFQDIYKETNNNALIHGLGYVTYPMMLRLPLYSVDSSTWKAASARFGVLHTWDNGLKGVLWRELLNGKKRITTAQALMLNKFKITPRVFAVESNHKGSKSIEALCNIYANLQFQKVCKRSGLDYFLAVSNTQDLERIIRVSEDNNSLTYEKFKALY